MRLLVLGGTSFVGRALVETAVSSGHSVTLFNRGRTQPRLFADLTRLVGDRDAGDYASLAAGAKHWDAVVDVSTYVPRHVNQALDALENRFGRYLFVSTGSTYDPGPASPGLDETSPRWRPSAAPRWWTTRHTGR